MGTIAHGGAVCPAAPGNPPNFSLMQLHRRWARVLLPEPGAPVHETSGDDDDS